MSFEDSNAGKDKNIIINGLQVEGEDAFNYSFKTPNVTASIYKKEVTLIGFDICDKIYDGLTLANIEGLPKLDGMLENETSLSYIGNLSAKFENSEIGENKKIYFDGLTLTGENACNYQLVYPEITANILPQPTYIIEYDVNNVDMGYIIGDVKQEVLHGNSASKVIAVPNEGYEFIKWSDGLTSNERTDSNITSSKNIVAIFEEEEKEFSFTNEISNTIIQSSQNIDKNGHIQIEASDTIDKSTILNEKIQLFTNELWKFELKFKVTSWGIGNTFTFMVVYDYENGIYALQIEPTRLRICLVGDNSVDEYIALEFGNNINKLDVNKEYIFSLISNGNSTLSINIIDENNTFVVNNQLITFDKKNYVIKCNVIGNSFVSNSNMGHSGIIYYLSISDNPDISEDTEYNIIYEVNNDLMGKIEGETTQTILRGQSGTEVVAIANEGYEFIKWSDGVLTPNRTDTNVLNSNTFIAIFKKIGDNNNFDFDNQMDETTIKNTSSIDENGIIQVSTNDTVDSVTTFDQKLVLTKDEIWTIVFQFEMSIAGENSASSMFTLFGTLDDQADGIYALQINHGYFRIYMNSEFSYKLSSTLSLYTKYELRLISYGNNTFDLIIKDINENQIIVNDQFVYNNSDYIVNCDVIGNSFFQGGNQNTSGKIYKLHILNSIDGGEIEIEDEFTLTYEVNDPSMGKIEGETTQTILRGQSGTEVVAIANEGYEFIKWSDGVLTPNRTDTNVLSSQNITAIFIIKGTANEFDFINEISDAPISNANNVDENGYITIGINDSVEQSTLLNEKIKLLTSEVWKFEIKFNISDWGSNNHFTFVGVSDVTNNINALQITHDKFRICSLEIGIDIYYDLNFINGVTSLESNKNYTFKIICKGDGVLIISLIEETVIIVDNQKINFNQETNQFQIMNCNVIGNSYYNGNNMGASGIVYYLHITKEL